MHSQWLLSVHDSRLEPHLDRRGNPGDVMTLTVESAKQPILCSGRRT